MDNLIRRSIQAQTSEAEDEQLREWRRSSEANERKYREIAWIWDLSGRIHRHDSHEPVPTLDELLKNRGARPAVIRPSATADRRRPWRRLSTAAAAVVALGFGIVQVWPRPQAEVSVAPAEIVTGLGELSTVMLGDRTVVRLAPSSRLRMAQGSGAGEAREVWLDSRPPR